MRLPPADSGGRPKGRGGPGLTRSDTLERRKSQLLRAVHKTTIISEILDNRTKQLVSVRFASGNIAPWPLQPSAQDATLASCQ